MPIEVEAQSLADVDAAIAAGADVILLDNLSIERHPRGRRAHRGPRQDRDLRRRDARAHAASSRDTGADYVSVGALTHSAPAVDLSFEIEPDV